MGNDEKNSQFFISIKIQIRIELRFDVIFEHYISAKQYTLYGWEKIGMFTQTHTLIIMNSAKEKYECEAYGVLMIMMIKIRC